MSSVFKKSSFPDSGRVNKPSFLDDPFAVEIEDRQSMSNVVK
jgi:hypothetical protein